MRKPPPPPQNQHSVPLEDVHYSPWPDQRDGVESEGFGPGGLSVRIYTPPKLQIRITEEYSGGETGQYAWEEVYRDAIDGSWVAASTGRSSESLAIPAVEANAKTVTLDEVYEAVLHESGEYYLFWVGGGGQSDLVHLTGKDYSGSCILYSGYYVTNDGCTYTAGETVCEPIYHERDFDIPVYPPTSPRSSRLTTFFSDDAAGSVAWSNPSNASSSNDTYATATVPASSSTEYLKALGGCFGIPTASTITNVEVRVEGKASASSGLADAEVKLVKGGTISGTSQHTGSDLGDSDSVRSYSASPATWGVALTADDVNAVNFGVALRYAATGAERTVSIDDIEIRVSFTPAGTTIARQAIYRVYRNAEGQLMFSGLPLTCFARRTGSSDGDGDIAYQRIWNQNTGAFEDRTLELRVKLME